MALARRVFLTTSKCHCPRMLQDSEVAGVPLLCPPQGTQKLSQNWNGDTKSPAQHSVQLHTLLGCDSHTEPTRGSEVK